MYTMLANWKNVGFIAVVIIFYSAGYYNGHLNTKALWNASIQAAEKATIEKERNINTASNIIDKGLQNEKDRFNRDYNDYLDELYATSPNLPQDNTTSKHNATACNNVLSKENKAYIAKLANDADKQTEQLKACISFIKEVTQ